MGNLWEWWIKDSKKGNGRNKSSKGLMYPQGGSLTVTSCQVDYLCAAESTGTVDNQLGIQSSSWEWHGAEIF